MKAITVGSVLTFNSLLELPNSIQAIGEFTVFGLAQFCPGLPDLGR
jgi:hypothetical protein